MRPDDGRLHFSELKYIATTPLEYQHKRANPPKDTLAFRLGRHAHALWLLGIVPPVWNEPNKKGTGVAPRNKKSAKYKEFCESHDESSVLTVEEYARVVGMVDALTRHPLASKIKKLCTEFEKEMAWERRGIECAGTLDMRGPRGIEAYGDNYLNGILAELKSCESRRIQPQSFQRQGEYYHYPEQCEWYSVGSGVEPQQRETPWPQCWVISVESSGAHDVVCHCLSDLRMDQANKTVDGWLERYAACKSINHWPGWSDIGVPWDANVEFNSTDADDD